MDKSGVIQEEFRRIKEPKQSSRHSPCHSQKRTRRMIDKATDAQTHLLTPPALKASAYSLIELMQSSLSKVWKLGKGPAWPPYPGFGALGA